MFFGLSWCLLPSFLTHCESDCTECLSVSRLSWGLLGHHLSEILASASIWGCPAPEERWCHGMSVLTLPLHCRDPSSVSSLEEQRPSSLHLLRDEVPTKQGNWAFIPWLVDISFSQLEVDTDVLRHSTGFVPWIYCRMGHCLRGEMGPGQAGRKYLVRRFPDLVLLLLWVWFEIAPSPRGLQ